jgi:hypothetical protein
MAASEIHKIVRSELERLYSRVDLHSRAIQEAVKVTDEAFEKYHIPSSYEERAMEIVRRLRKLPITVDGYRFTRQHDEYSKLLLDAHDLYADIVREYDN